MCGRSTRPAWAFHRRSTSRTASRCPARPREVAQHELRPHLHGRRAGRDVLGLREESALLLGPEWRVRVGWAGLVAVLGHVDIGVGRRQAAPARQRTKRGHQPRRARDRHVVRVARVAARERPGRIRMVRPAVARNLAEGGTGPRRYRPKPFVDARQGADEPQRRHASDAGNARRGTGGTADEHLCVGRLRLDRRIRGLDHRPVDSAERGNHSEPRRCHCGSRKPPSWARSRGCTSRPGRGTGRLGADGAGGGGGEPRTPPNTWSSSVESGGGGGAGRDRAGE